MRLALRVLGTWLLGLALVLLVIDGTKSLAASTPTATSLGALWSWLNAAGWASAETVIAGWPSPLGETLLRVFGWPGWAVSGALGVCFLALGRRRSHPGYIEMN